MTTNVGSLGGASLDNDTLLIDLSIGVPKTAKVLSQPDAAAYYSSDIPLWNNRPLGITVRNSFFGSAGPNQPTVGFLGALLPIRAAGVLPGILHEHFEIVFDGASASFTSQNTEPGMLLELTTTYARIGRKILVVGRGTPIKSVTARALLDRIDLENGILSFHVADFRILIRSHFVVFPIRLKSKDLQHALNNGEIPLMPIPPTVIALPVCVYTGYEKTVSPPNTCNPQPLIGYMGYLSGPRSAALTVDPTSFMTRFAQFAIDGQQWSGWQVAAQVKIAQ